MVAAAMEGKRLGLWNKSLFVVPNHIIEQFASEFLQLYPSANILVTSKKDFAMNNRKKFCSKISTGQYDAIIMGHSQFEKIQLSQERQAYFLNQQIDALTLSIDDLKKNGAEYYSIKQLEKSKKKVEEKLNVENETNNSIKISFSAKYMMEALKSFSTETVDLHFVGEVKPILIKSTEDETLTQLVLPIRTY